MAKKLKNIKLEEDVLRDLFKQAVECGYNNLQNYLEDVLVLQSKRKIKDFVADLQAVRK